VNVTEMSHSNSSGHVSVEAQSKDCCRLLSRQV